MLTGRVKETEERVMQRASISPYESQCSYMSSFTSHINEMKQQHSWTLVPLRTSFKNYMLSN